MFVWRVFLTSGEVVDVHADAMRRYPDGTLYLILYDSMDDTVKTFVSFAAAELVRFEIRQLLPNITDMTLPDNVVPFDPVRFKRVTPVEDNNGVA